MIGWLVVEDAEVPDDDGWLQPAERVTLAGLSRPKRRADWRRGRLAAKRAVARVLGVAEGDVAVRAAGDGAPVASVRGVEPPVTVSISHSGGRAVCVVAVPAVAVGCDVELIEAREAAFVEDFFTPQERTLVASTPAGERDLIVTLIWSAKESALKARREGLRRDTRSIEVRLPHDGAGAWCTLDVSDLEGGVPLQGWWRRLDGFVLTVVSEEVAAPVPAMAAIGHVDGPMAPAAGDPRPWSVTSDRT